MNIASNGEPCADGSQGKSDAEVDMSKVGETFGKGIETNNREAPGGKE